MQRSKGSSFNEMKKRKNVHDEMKYEVCICLHVYAWMRIPWHRCYLRMVVPFRCNLVKAGECSCELVCWFGCQQLAWMPVPGLDARVEKVCGLDATKNSKVHMPNTISKLTWFGH